MDNNFTAISQLRFWCQKVLPLVYDDSLSYYEVLCKIQAKLNDLIENNNLLPDYIANLIKEYISSGEIEKVLADVLANYMLNVKFPPKGLTPAKGDGTADDTTAIQGCIDYAYSHGGMAVYFPSGKYLTQPLTLRNKATLFGQDRYTTQLVMKGGAINAMFTGVVDELSLTGLGFDGNMDIQVNNVNLFDITVNSAIISNVLLTDGYDLLNVTINKDLQISNAIFDHAVENGLVVNGSGYVQGDNIIFNTVSSLIGKNFIVLNTNISCLEKIKCVGPSPNCVLINGNHNTVKLWNQQSLKTYIDNGQGNCVENYTIDEIKKLGGNLTVNIGGDSQESITGNKVLTANTLDETLIGDKNVNVNNLSETTKSNYTENVTGDKSVNAKNITNTSTAIYKVKSATLTEETNTKNVNAETVIETLTGDKTVQAKNLSEKITTLKSVETLNSTETIKGFKTVDVTGKLDVKADTMAFTATKELGLKGADITLDSVNPVTYKKPITLNKNFKYVPMKDTDGNPYKVLVEGDTLDFSDVVSAKDFGAKGDGVTDDSVALNNFFEYVGDNNLLGFIPNGTYLISTVITYRKSQGTIRITGESENGVVIKRKEGLGISAVDFRNCNVSYFGNVTIDMNAQTTMYTGMGLNLVDCNSVITMKGLIERVSIINVDYCGFQCYSSLADTSHFTYNLVLRNVSVKGMGKGWGSDGVHPAAFIFENGWYCGYEDCLSMDVNYYGMEFKDYSRGCWFDNCTIINAKEGFYLGGDSPVGGSYYCQHVNISNCNAFNVDLPLYAGKANYVNINNVTIRGEATTACALQLLSSSNVMVSNVNASLTGANLYAIIDGVNQCNISLNILELSMTGTKRFDYKNNPRDVFVSVITNNLTITKEGITGLRCNLSVPNQAKWFGDPWVQA